MPFDYHDDPDLAAAYQGFQGQHPEAARCIFIGSDANFPTKEDYSPREEYGPKKAEWLAYLSDGPTWCLAHDKHHPLAPAAVENARDYHSIFAGLFLRCGEYGLDRTEVLKRISFVDLLCRPTQGSAGEVLPRYRGFLREEANLQHLRQVGEWLCKSKALVVLPTGVLKKFLQVTLNADDLVMDTGAFARILVQRYFPYFRGRGIDGDYIESGIDSLARKIANHW